MSRVMRLLSELAHAEESGDDVVAKLRFRIEGDVAVVGEGDGAFEALAGRRFSCVRFDREVYRRVPGRASRVRLLRIASAASRDEVVVHVPVGSAGSHPARVAIDVPRAALRRLELPAAEPGDRFPEDGFAHLFFDEEPLVREFDDAGLAVRERRGFTFVLERRRATPVSDAEPFVVELARVMKAARDAERMRMNDPPERAVAAMRARGKNAAVRDAVGRARLRRAIGWVDAMMPRGANCYRRTLLELALDAGAAGEPLVFGLDVGATGHVAFKDREDVSFDVVFEIPA
jgi:hypothetical protein